jgi:hypothetical protein
MHFAWGCSSNRNHFDGESFHENRCSGCIGDNFHPDYFAMVDDIRCTDVFVDAA